MTTVESKVVKLNELIEQTTHQLIEIQKTKVVESIKPAISRILRDLILVAIDGARQEVGAYGTNTHSYDSVNAFYVLVKNK